MYVHVSSYNKQLIFFQDLHCSEEVDATRLNIYIYTVFGCYINLRIYDNTLSNSKISMLAWCQATVLQVRAS